MKITKPAKSEELLMSKVKTTLEVNGKSYSIFSLKKAKEAGLGEIDKLPKSLKVLLENLLRHELLIASLPMLRTVRDKQELGSRLKS